MNIKQIVLLVAGLLIILGGLLIVGNLLEPKTAGGLAVTSSSTLQGVQDTPAPWIPEITNLHERLAVLHLPALAQEGTALHIHQHLDLLINGNVVSVPAGIGINEAQNFISPIHVHDTTGIIHVESPTIQDYTLGQFFDIWGLKFSATCIGSYCTDATHTLKVYENGTLLSGDPRSLVLKPHAELMIVYGTASSTPPTIISTYTFPAGY